MTGSNSIVTGRLKIRLLCKKVGTKLCFCIIQYILGLLKVGFEYASRSRLHRWESIYHEGYKFAFNKALMLVDSGSVEEYVLGSRIIGKKTYRKLMEYFQKNR